VNLHSFGAFDIEYQTSQLFLNIVLFHKPFTGVIFVLAKKLGHYPCPCIKGDRVEHIMTLNRLWYSWLWANKL